jgi:hypothetical protein
MPLGNALAGPLSHEFGINRVFIGCAAVLFASGVAPLFVAGSRRLVRLVSHQQSSAELDVTAYEAERSRPTAPVASG